MRILFLSPRQSLPARSGAKLREYHFLRALGRENEVTYVYFSDPGADALSVQDVPFCREVVAVPKPPAYGAAKNIAGLFGRWPLPVLNYTSPAMSDAVERAAAAADFDFIHVDSIHMIRYAMDAVRAHPGIRAVYNWHNIESEAMRRFAATTPSRARRWYASMTAGKIERLEREILRTARGHIVCSERERMQLLECAPEARVAVVENGVDTKYFAGGSGSAEKTGLVFVGTMDYFPNADAAIFFARRIWPQVRARFPRAEFTIVGANPPPEVKTLGEAGGIHVTGMVPDVRPYYRGALAAVVPLRTGGGTRLKILEAMAAGVPVISTPLGAEGLDASDGRDILLADAEDSEAWVSRLAQLAESAALRERLRNAGLELVQGRYDWEVLGTKLAAIYRSWM
ncbi:MAG: glycosyltransferase [Acidobacteriota bacterium]|nr:glycosyltransferase [Acidobacteriota bacterium]